MRKPGKDLADQDAISLEVGECIEGDDLEVFRQVIERWDSLTVSRVAGRFVLSNSDKGKKLVLQYHESKA